jgi:hypothetical protein
MYFKEIILTIYWKNLSAKKLLRKLLTALIQSENQDRCTLAKPTNLMIMETHFLNLIKNIVFGDVKLPTKKLVFS